MVAGKKYNVKATLKPEYAANFEFVDASGEVLPDATASTSQEFEYEDDNGSGNGSSDNREESIWYKMQVITEMVVAATLIGLFITFIVLIIKLKSKKKQHSDDTRAKDKEDGSNNTTE